MALPCGLPASLPNDDRTSPFPGERSWKAH
jgi:hypothetical protein